ncbi:MAG: tRNA lysidine(34) synthetase TilS [Hyphomicrobiaceae bacterium]
MGEKAPVVTMEEAERLLAPLAAFDAIVLAVSGGPDSMALMHLAAEWFARHPDTLRKVLVITVDHGLRPESAQEAHFVLQCAAKLALPHRTLEWEGEKPARGIPASARAARYLLLESAALGLGGASVCIVSAHTRDDQAETFLMRLKRGSGLDGLSAMAPRTSLREESSVTLLRPLLDVPKVRLIATLEARGVNWVEDPTNACLDYERPALRVALSRLSDEGIGADAIATSARRLGEAREAMDYAVARFTETLELSFNDEIYSSLSRSAFDAGPAHLRMRVLAHLISRFGGASPVPQLSEVEDMVKRMSSDGRLTATLGGAVVTTTARQVKVWREAGRVDVAPMTLDHSGVWQTWDRRFRVRTRRGVEGVEVGMLGETDRQTLVGPLLDPRCRLPAAAVAALPAFRVQGKLVAVPSLQAYLQADPAMDLSGGEELDAEPLCH